VLQVFDTNNTGPLYQMSSKRLRLAYWHWRERMRAVTYAIDVYINNGRWNGVDLAIIVMFIVSFSLRYALPISTFQIDRVFFSFTIIICYFRLLRFWFVLPSIGPRIIAIEMMVIYCDIYLYIIEGFFTLRHTLQMDCLWDRNHRMYTMGHKKCHFFDYNLLICRWFL